MKSVLSSEFILKDTYEAEEAEIVNASVSVNFDSFKGSGCVTDIKKDSSVTFSAEVITAAEYALIFRYANGTDESKALSLMINGEDCGEIEFPITPNGTTWCEKFVAVSLVSGTNRITLSCTSEENGGISLDNMKLARIYRAENVSTLYEHTGYTGEGYVSFYEKGQRADFVVDAPVTGDYELTFRYSSSHTDSDGRSLTFDINEEHTEQIWLNPTRSDDMWGVYHHKVSLNKGQHKLTLSYGEKDRGEINLDCITLKPTVWEYAGRIESIEGSGTERLSVKLDNCVIRIDSVSQNSLRVWVDPQGRFVRKYESAAVAKESVAPCKLFVNEEKEYYYFKTGELTVRLYKDPFRIAYLDSGGVVAINDAKGLGWSTDGELICRNVKKENEHFWGLGETPIPFDRTGRNTALWGNDIVAARGDSAVPANFDEGRWYMNNPVFTSSKGYTVLFDNPSRTVFDFGAEDPDTYYFASLNPYPAGELVYYFIYGPSIKDEMESLSDIIGKSFFAPYWGYGNTQSHWGYTQADIERVAQEYRDRNIPLELIIADIEWYQYFCTPTEWNKENFPEPDRMKKLLDKLHLRFGVIDDPNITASCDDYKQGDEMGCFVKGQDRRTLNVHWPWGWQSGLADFFDPKTREWWKDLHKMILDFGVDFFWMDMNEPAKYNANWYFYNEEGKSFGTLADCKNVFAQMQQRTMHSIMTQNGKRSLLLTRSGYTGTHRYACPWTGDIHSDWVAMKQQLSLGLGLSMSGYMYWTFDICGSAGAHTDEQFKRWIELGTFMPVTRYHSTAKPEHREPYTHGAEDIARKYISLRYRLIPYFYSLSADSVVGIGMEGTDGGSGLPLVRPMLMEFEKDENTWGMDSQFMSGQSFLVAPVMDGELKKSVYLPEGDWYDYNGNTVYGGNRSIEYDAPIDLLPVLVKAGSIIPMRDVVQYIGEKEMDTLYLDIFPTISDGDYSFINYEDDGETDKFTSGEYATTKFSGSTRKNTHSVTVEARQGNYKEIADRDYILQFHILDSDFVSAEVNGKKVEKVSSVDGLSSVNDGYYFDKPTGVVYVKTHDTAKEITVSVTVE